MRLEIVFIGWSEWYWWKVGRPGYEASCLRWYAYLGPVLIRRYK